jgi:small basic protein
VPEVSIEVVPVVTGVVVGQMTWLLVPRRFRASVAVCVSLPLGAVITYLAGELELSWAFIVYDVGQVILASLLTLGFAHLWSLVARARLS